jgi:hypothetical protein
MVDRPNTKTMLSRRHIGQRDDDFCVLCNSREEETIEHLFFYFFFVRECWTKLNFTWDLSLNLGDRIIQAKKSIGLDFFIKATLKAAWELWKVRNDKIFNRHKPTVSRWFCNFRSQSLLLSARFRTDLRSSFCFWLDAFS